MANKFICLICQLHFVEKTIIKNNRPFKIKKELSNEQEMLSTRIQTYDSDSNMASFKVDHCFSSFLNYDWVEICSLMC